MNLKEILNGFRVSHHFLKGLFCNSKGEYNLYKTLMIDGTLICHGMEIVET